MQTYLAEAVRSSWVGCAGLNAAEDLAPGTYMHNRVWETLSAHVGGEPGSACDLDQETVCHVLLWPEGLALFP